MNALKPPTTLILRASKNILIHYVMSLVLFLMLSLSATAAAHYVTVNGSAFSPATLTIEVGDTVIWENTDDFFSHSTTSDLGILEPGYWNGWLINQGDTYDLTFASPGTFSYHDQFDSGTGTITVTSPSTPLIQLETPRQVGSQFLFDATGLTVGKTNIVQASTNLTAWIPVATNIADSAAMTFTNPATLPQRYFRLLQLP